MSVPHAASGASIVGTLHTQNTRVLICFTKGVIYLGLKHNDEMKFMELHVLDKNNQKLRWEAVCQKLIRCSNGVLLFRVFHKGKPGKINFFRCPW